MLLYIGHVGDMESTELTLTCSAEFAAAGITHTHTCFLWTSKAHYVTVKEGYDQMFRSKQTRWNGLAHGALPISL